MEALQFNSKAKTLSLINKPIPSSVKEGWVLIKVAYSGVCGTDLHAFEGSFPCSDSPVIMGHEFSGTVTAVGPNVTHLKVGDRVAVDPNSGCETCDACTAGQPHYCEVGGICRNVGMMSDGGWAEYCAAPAKQVYKLPNSISFEQGALVEPISCVSHGWDMLQPVPLGSRILIIGAGIIGNLWACILHIQGHRKVTVCEPMQERRKIVENLGFGFQVVSPDNLKKLKEKDEKFGFEVVIDCSGNGKAIEDAVWMLRCGGKLAIFGCAAPETRVSVSPFLLYKNEITIFAVKINPFSFPKALGFLESMGASYTDYEKLGVKVFTMKQHQQAFSELKKGLIAKAVFKIGN